MSTLNIQYDASAANIGFDSDFLHVYLVDGRELLVPLAWFPKLRDADLEKRDNWRLIGDGEGIHWPDLDEDISVPGLLGQPD